MSGLPREVIKWLQSLDLSHPIKNVKRDFSNGYLVAEILAWYYPHDLQMHSFSNGTSLTARQGNWEQLERLFLKEKFDIPKELIDNTIHCKPSGAKLLIERLYTLLTLKELKYLPAKCTPDDFTDRTYQSQLPLYARATASQSIKNNLANTELATEPDYTVCSSKAQAIVDVYNKQKQNDKECYPERFSTKPKLKVSPIKDKGAGTDGVEEISVTQSKPPNL
ncbi:PREDICTED: spermatogenesis-associated protein 4-like isoform X2 [Amphimedon queenslandica]|uniref:Spermatogenesis-associated protein 4 n=1 Tax=Amphimedon queenslandica TaxID=400682 RepID=A0AAN0IFG1_AMPQE|nr:PREDICTED: spermatogenesis-associated protein 4-like isoform X2 [Amphimedon queenslandica]|eukprot:XP_003387695.1 PREDICTED: spermatogenesis-associated protein 4-like isoform X2 [Amphimedon queenslandica]